jgi:hypothetical protein
VNDPGRKAFVSRHFFFLPQPPGVSHGLHLVVCAVVVCDKQQHQQNDAPFKCMFGGGSFLASQVSVSLAIDDDATRQAGGQEESARLQTEPEVFLFLPMAAAGDGSSFSPHMLQVGAQAARHTSHAALSRNVQRTSVSSVELEAEQPVHRGGQAHAVDVASVVVFGIGQPQRQS